MAAIDTTFAAPDGTSLRERRWMLTGGSARGTVLLIHGFGEHIARYDHVAAALNTAGFHVVGSDLRGHGESGGLRGFCRRVDEFIEDATTLAARAREHAGGEGPLFVLGHSFGGFLATRLLLQRPELARGLVLSSPLFQLKLPVPAPKLIVGRLLSSVWPTLAMANELHGHDVSRDPEVQRAYDADTRMLKKATVRWFTEWERGAGELRARAGELRVPLLLLHGGADRVAAPVGSEQLFAHIGSSDKTLEILPGYFHEIFNDPEPDRQQALTRVTAWLAARAS